MKKYKLIDNTRERSFEFHIDGEIARIDYMITTSGDIALVHTEVADALQGRGVGKALVEAVLEHIDQTGRKVIPTCGFVRGYIRKHPEWNRLVAMQNAYY
jgi:predicted GNAT family acetyltransferase